MKYSIILLLLGLFTSCNVQGPQRHTLPSADSGQYKSYATENRYKSVVRIFTTCKDGSRSMGTGVAISKRSVITAYHVVDCPLERVQIRLWNGTKIEAKLVAQSKKDAARLESESDLNNWMPVSTVAPKIDDIICYTGGGGLVDVITTKCGRVFAYDEEDDFWVSMHVVPGNSGGPVFNEYWEVVGIIDWRYVDMGPSENWEETGGGVLAKYFP